ncbi:CGNR zinc finger domain-containing protein [Agrococcus sp. HG114]|uniref:CGNR zinc finger domain-containing protein n=1 Tax=Agrococcus sp. HG114 TaxID=2969757 RepID=UPI00215B71D2|nr:CGNR zinc finger domain-containing protein [Agrococcus sp. HG114]MCR8670128.1 CGNR zinc finger domain-containing protein [Agrococcus sp. HG114]
MAPPYPRELVRSLEFIADVCNRRREGELTTAASLRRLCAEWGFPGTSTVTKADAEATWAVLPTIERMWDADRDTVAALVNRVFEQSDARPRLARHDDSDWHLHGLPAGAPLADVIAVDAAMALADLVRLDDLARCSRCADDRCERMFFDLSRNRSRRFCSTRCQSRTNVAAFRARHPSAPRDAAARD